MQVACQRSVYGRNLLPCAQEVSVLFSFCPCCKFAVADSWLLCYCCLGCFFNNKCYLISIIFPKQFCYLFLSQQILSHLFPVLLIYLLFSFMFSRPLECSQITSTVDLPLFEVPSSPIYFFQLQSIGGKQLAVTVWVVHN